MRQRREDPLTVAPDILVYLFPELFSRRKRFGGKKVSPLSSIKIDVKTLYRNMVAAEVLYYYYLGHITLNIVKQGLLFKRDRVVVKKIKNIARRRSQLGREINKLLIGEQALLKDVLEDKIFGSKRDYPEYEYMARVAFNTAFKKVEKRLDDPVYVGQLRVQATWLRDLLEHYKGGDPWIYWAIIRDAEKAAKNMTKPAEYD